MASNAGEQDVTFLLARGCGQLSGEGQAGASLVGEADSGRG